MGFNTVAFLLNDLMHTLENSPHAVTFGLTHPPHSNEEREQRYWRQMVESVAKQHNEPTPHPQALEMMGTVHADFTQYYRAGGNCISRLKVVRYGKTKEGKATITLELPEWFDPKRHT